MATVARRLEKYVILKRPRVHTRDAFGGLEVLARGLLMDIPDGGEVEVDVAELRMHEVADVRRDPEVLSIAPSMPTHLIEPLNVANVAPMAGTVAWGVEMVGAPQSGFSGNGVTVAVLDTGIDATHPAFAGVNLIQQDFTGEGNGDAHGHGTHCAGTIFGRDVSGVRIGIARGVQRALIGKVLGSQGGSTESIANAITWAVEQGANVISMSLGIDFPGFVARRIDAGFPKELATSMALEAFRTNVRLYDTLAAQVRARGFFGRGTVIVAAAGNESRRRVDPRFELTVAPPATADGIISVGALGQTGNAADPLEVADFSNTGPNVAAPGVAIQSARRGGGLVSMDGTSMATPHVAGVAALWAEKLLQESGRLVADQLVARLVGNARRLSSLDPMDVGSGLVAAP